MVPDWSYNTLFEPVLKRVPSPKGREFIHHGMSLISSIPGGSKVIEFLGHMETSPILEKNLFGITFTNPVGLSGKIDPNLSGTRAFAHLGMGFIEVGPVLSIATLSEPPRFTQTKDNLIYTHSLESIGVNETIKKLEKIQPYNKPIFIRLGATDSYEETLALAMKLQKYADAFILENRVSEEELENLRANLVETPLLYSFSYRNMDFNYIEELVTTKQINGLIIEEEAIDHGDGLVFPLSQVDKLSEAIHQIKGKMDIPIIISGGISEPNESLSLFRSGADLVMLSNGYVFSGPGMPKRINEALLTEKAPATSIETYRGWIWYWLFGLFMLIGGIAALIVSMTIIVMPYDEAFLGLTREELFAINPNIIRFMQHDRMTVAGTMMSGGFLYMQLARYGVRYGLQWAKRAIHVAGIVGFLGILLFIGFGYFDWLHGLLWLVLLPFFWKGYRETRNYAEHPRSKNLTNHPAWKKSLWGQLSFVTLGFSFVLGGIVISTIGVTGVFVPTDLLYICMTPEQLTEINNRLIPVIAHDRAGLGSALLSVGLLVLMLALWGFHEGEKWIWYSFLIGGIPAFSAGVFIHFVIGYTSFFHLLPAYFALFLFIVGLVLSKDFFLKGIV